MMSSNSINNDTGLTSEASTEGTNGDIILRSRDHATFSFHRWLLIHCSPVFKDILGMKSTDQRSNSVIDLDEDAITIATLLHHLDPAKPYPKVDVKTIAGTLKAADKYQIGTILPWFHHEVLASKESEHGPIKQAPILLLALGLSYKQSDIIKSAALEAVTCNRNTLGRKDTMNYPQIYVEVITFREKRFSWLQSKVKIIASSEAKDMIVYSAARCKYASAAWVTTILQDILHTPTWRQFEASFKAGNDLPPCRTCDRKLPEHFMDLFTTWAKSAGELDKLVPFNMR